MPFAPTPDGVRIYYEESGAGEPLLLIPGRNGDHHLFNLIRGGLAERYRVIDFDNRGAGQSEKPEAPPYSTPGFARDAVALLDHLRIPRAHIYGVSMGGAIGQWLGVNHPDRVGCLVLACSNAGVAHGVRRSEEVSRILASGDPGQALSLLFARKRALPRFFLSMRDSHLNPMPAYAECLHGEASESHDAWDQLPSITAPTLILHGDDDPVTPAENARLLAARIPGAELFLVPGGRHMFFIESRRRLRRVILDFLARHPLAAPPHGPTESPTR